MTRTQIEAWALGAIENALAGRHTEDSGVELKSDWPKDHARAARQIAAHANAAHGEPILWIVGVDERARCLADPTVIEIADWWAQVRKCFCEVIPELTHVNVRISDKAVCALCFLTDRAPYVVRHAGGDDKSFDVPWREGNGTRSATRGELLRMLASNVPVPDIEVIGGEVTAEFETESDGARPTRVSWSVWLTIYVSPPTNANLAIPTRRCSGSINVPSWDWPDHPDIILANFDLQAPAASAISFRGKGQPYETRIRKGANEIFVDGAGQVEVRAYGTSSLPRQSFTSSARVTVQLRATNVDKAVGFTADFDHMKLKEEVNGTLPVFRWTNW